MGCLSKARAAPNTWQSLAQAAARNGNVCLNPRLAHLAQMGMLLGPERLPDELVRVVVLKLMNCYGEQGSAAWVTTTSPSQLSAEMAN